MEEKILIESRPSKTWKKILLGLIIGIFVIALLFWGLQISAMRSEYIGELDNAKYWYNRHGSYSTFEKYIEAERPDLKNFFGYYLGSPFWDSSRGLVLSIFTFLFIGLGIIATVMYFGYIKSKLSVTEMNIKGNTLFGKVVVLPLHMVSGYSTSKILSKIVVSTSSGIIKFYLIDNFQDICEVLKGLLNTRQKKTETISKMQMETNFRPTNSNADELKKYKELLDGGVITQEEFDAKKTQLLGL